MESKQLSELKGNPTNPRTISKVDFENLKKSIKEFGDLSGVVLNVRTSQLVGGHQRVEAFKALGGQSEVNVQERFTDATNKGTVAYGYVILDGERYSYREVDWDPTFELAANIAANRITGQFDNDLLAEVTYQIQQENESLLALTGQTDAEISKLLDMVGVTTAGEDEAPEVDDVNPPVSKLGEVYQLGRHRLMCGSATDLDDVNLLMNGELADMIFTDPPYNVAYEGKTAEALTIQNDSMSDGDFYKFLYDAHVSMNVATKPGGSIYVCHADSEGMNFRKSLMDTGFLLKQCIIWVKQSMVMGRQDYQWQHEPILYGWKDGASHFFVDDRTQTTVWNIDRPSKNIEHPTMKPIELCARAIKNSSQRGGLVIDFFSGSGSGSTLIACEENDRSCCSMELDPRYVDVIRKRWSNLTEQSDWISATPIVATQENKSNDIVKNQDTFTPPEIPQE